MSLRYGCLSTSFAWCVASQPSFIHLLVSVVVWYYIVECSLFSTAQKLSFSFCSSFGKTHKQSLFSFLLIRKSADICPIQSLYIWTFAFSIVPSSDRGDEFGLMVVVMKLYWQGYYPRLVWKGQVEQQRSKLYVETITWLLINQSDCRFYLLYVNLLYMCACSLAVLTELCSVWSDLGRVPWPVAQCVGLHGKPPPHDDNEWLLTSIASNWGVFKQRVGGQDSISLHQTEALPKFILLLNSEWAWSFVK